MSHPSEFQADLVVVGGGAAGLAAAVTAAREGARTLLIERQTMLGGMGSAALVHTICGLYLLRAEPGAVYANEGFAQEFAERLRREGGASDPVRMGRLDVLPHHPVAFAVLADRLVEEAKNVQVFCQTELIAARAESGFLQEIEVACCGRRSRIRAKAFVDASGDANLVALAGGVVEQIDSLRLQRPAYVFAVQGLLNQSLTDEKRLQAAHAIATAVKQAALPPAALGASFRSSLRPGEAFCTIDLQGDHDLPYDPTSGECLAKLSATGRKVAMRLADYMRCHVEGFDQAWISSWPARPGIRESRRAVGQYQLTSEDILQGAIFEDGVALATWPMELRESPRGPRWRYLEGDRPCQIPLRALRSASFSNVFVAGRCLSCDHEAQASIRVIGTCFATGEAAARASLC